MTAPEPLAVRCDDAAVMCGVSVDIIRRAVRSGDLPAHYPTARPVVLVDDLRAWLSATPERRTA